MMRARWPTYNRRRPSVVLISWVAGPRLVGRAERVHVDARVASASGALRACVCAAPPGPWSGARPRSVPTLLAAATPDPARWTL